jgi:citrate lyase subunit beta/citryl-CoA lyase
VSTWTTGRPGSGRGDDAARVGVADEVFTPAPEEVDRACALVARFEAATASGAGVLLHADGRMVDEAVVRAARRVLDLVPDRQHGAQHDRQ